MDTFKEEWSRLLTVVQQNLRTESKRRRAYLVLAAAYLTAFSALLLARVNYLDDTARTIWGYRDFGFNRFLSNFFSVFVHGDTHITDISPVTQLMAILILSLASLVLLLFFRKGRKIRIWDVAAVLPLGLSPYFLECMSYKYDSPYMALSVLAAVLPLLVCNAHGLIYITATGLSAIVICTTYQASSGIFPMAVVFLVARMWRENEKLEDILWLVAKSVLGYLAGLLIFRLFIMVPIDDYAGTSMFPLRLMPYGIVKNLGYYYQRVFQLDFAPKWLLCIGVMAVTFAVCAACQSKRNKLLTFAVSVLALLVAGALAFGAYIALEQPLFECRAMLGFGAFVALLGVNTVELEKSVLAKMACICLSWMLAVLALTYGNALAENQRYIDFRIQMVLQDLNDLDAMQEETVQLQIHGDAGDSPVLRQMKFTVPVLDRLIEHGFRGSGWMYDWFYFYEYFGLPNVERTTGLEALDLPLLKSGYYQDIYGEGNQILVVLKNPYEQK